MNHAFPSAGPDHLVFAAPSLEDGCRRVEALLGVAPAPGGRHPNWGTHNALLSLGPGAYLEVVAPDPRREFEATPLAFNLPKVREPTLATWSFRTPRLEEARSELVAMGCVPGPVTSGSRFRPDGTQLEWELTDPEVTLEGGVLPFLIDWGRSPHPSLSTPPGGQLLSLELTHPEPARVEAALALLGSPASVELREGPSPALRATIRRTDGGVVHLQ